MRILRLALVGVLALSAPIVANADTLGAKMKPTRPVPGMPQLSGGSGSAGAGSIEPVERVGSPPLGAKPQLRLVGRMGDPNTWGGPYTAWGGAYVPYRSHGDGGAL